jgi:hypothetical protein
MPGSNKLFNSNPGESLYFCFSFWMQCMRFKSSLIAAFLPFLLHPSILSLKCMSQTKWLIIISFLFLIHPSLVKVPSIQFSKAFNRISPAHPHPLCFTYLHLVTCYFLLIILMKIEMEGRKEKNEGN